MGDTALVGLSQIRETRTFGGMPVAARHPRLLCAVALVDIRTGRRRGLVEFTSACTELYDLRFLPQIRRPNVLNLEREAARQAIALTPALGYWLRPENAADTGEQGPGGRDPSPIPSPQPLD